MWSFSRNPLVNVSTDSDNQCVNPDQACGIQPVPFTPIDHNMDTGRITLRKFSGYPTEDPDRFLSDFEAYCVFSRIEGQNARKVAAFQLHLQGPAQTWFCCLDDDVKNDWEVLKDLFEIKYGAENNTPVLLVEAEQFNKLQLLSTQQIEDYYCKVIEKGRKLHKSDQEVLLKFIQGLPHQLAFFVRAGNPADISAALTSAKMGEAYGYRSPVNTAIGTAGGTIGVQTVAAAARTDTSSDRIQALEKTVLSLGDKLGKLLTSDKPQTQTNNSSLSGRDPQQRVCFSCNAGGHLKRRCNLAVGSGDPSVQCQLCSQWGHTGKQCRLFVDDSGNGINPRSAGRGPLGGQK